MPEEKVIDGNLYSKEDDAWELVPYEVILSRMLEAEAHLQKLSSKGQKHE